VLTATVDGSRELHPLLAVPGTGAAKSTGWSHRQGVLLRRRTVGVDVETNGSTAAGERTPLYQRICVDKCLEDQWTQQQTTWRNNPSVVWSCLLGERKGYPAQLKKSLSLGDLGESGVMQEKWSLFLFSTQLAIRTVKSQTGGVPGFRETRLGGFLGMYSGVWTLRCLLLFCIKRLNGSIAVNKHISDLHGHQLPHGITQCYLPADTTERALPSP